MAIANQISTDFLSVVQTYGVPVKIQMNVGSFVDSDYDESLVYSASGSLQTGSGFLVSLGKAEIPYLEQGRLDQTDQILFIGSEFQINSMSDIVANGGSYMIAPAGIIPRTIEGLTIFNKVYIRGKI
jgi:hypothetical protein